MAFGFLETHPSGRCPIALGDSCRRGLTSCPSLLVFHCRPAHFGASHFGCLCSCLTTDRLLRPPLHYWHARQPSKRTKKKRVKNCDNYHYIMKLYLYHFALHLGKHCLKVVHRLRKFQLHCWCHICVHLWCTVCLQWQRRVASLLNLIGCVSVRSSFTRKKRKVEGEIALAHVLREFGARTRRKFVSFSEFSGRTYGVFHFFRCDFVSVGLCLSFFIVVVLVVCLLCIDVQFSTYIYLQEKRWKVAKALVIHKFNSHSYTYCIQQWRVHFIQMW